MTNQRQRDWFIEAARRTGDGVDPRSFFDARARPHPLGSLLQQARLTGAWRGVAVRHYVSVPWPGDSPLTASIAHAEEDGGFVLHRWNTEHDVLREGPDRVLSLLEQTVAELNAERIGRAHHTTSRP